MKIGRGQEKGFSTNFSHLVIYSYGNDSCSLRMYGRNGVAPAVGQHGAFDVGVVHLHHEGARDAGALLQPQARLSVLILPSKTRQLAIREPMGTRWAAETSFPRRLHVCLTLVVGQFLMWWPAFPQR